MSTATQSAYEWAQHGRQAMVDATEAIDAGKFGTAEQFRKLADECFAKEKALREIRPVDETPTTSPHP